MSTECQADRRHEFRCAPGRVIKGVGFRYIPRVDEFLVLFNSARLRGRYGPPQLEAGHGM